MPQGDKQSSGGLMGTVYAMVKTLKSKRSYAYETYTFKNIQRRLLHERIQSVAANPDLPESSRLFVDAVAATSRHLDEEGVGLSEGARIRLSSNVVAVGRGEYGATFGHAREIATFLSEASSAVTAGESNRYGEALVGIVANAAGALAMGAQQHKERTLGL